jgi:hypothetical protein
MFGQWWLEDRCRPHLWRVSLVWWKDRAACFLRFVYTVLLMLVISSYTVSSQETCVYIVFKPLVHIWIHTRRRHCRVLVMSAKVYVRCCMCVVRLCAAMPQLAASTLFETFQILVYVVKR